MRLGQLARHINISPTEILDYLQTQGFPLEGGTNTRLSEDQIRMVLIKFAPDRVGEVVTLVAEEDKPENDPTGPAPSLHDFSEATSIPSPESAETIRAPKVELQGLKVLGKIELPEPRKKQIDRAPEPPAGYEERSKSYRDREQRQQRPWTNPVERQRMREAREAEERKRKLAEQRKEARTAAYLSRQEKLKSTSRLKQKTNSELQEEARVARVKKSRPTSFFGRIWFWLTNAE